MKELKIANAEDFAAELGIIIPVRFVKDPNLVCVSSDSEFFTTNERYGVFPEIEAQILAREENFGFTKLRGKDEYFLAFGQSGYGFNSWTFNICYANDVFCYLFKTAFGGVFISPNETNTAKVKIDNGFQVLSKIIDNKRFEKNETYFIAYNDNLEDVICNKFDSLRNTWSKADAHYLIG